MLCGQKGAEKSKVLLEKAESEVKPFCNILVNKELKLYMLLTDDEIGDGDTYVLGDLTEDGWETFCNTQRGHRKAVLFMEEFYPEYRRLSYVHKQYPLNEVKDFIDENHRHHLSPQGCNFAFGVKLGEWNCKSRPRCTKAPTCPKNMWEYVIAG